MPPKPLVPCPYPMRSLQEWRIAADLYARGPHWSEFQGPAAGPPPPAPLPDDPSTTPPDHRPDPTHMEHHPNGAEDQEGDTITTGHRAHGGSSGDSGGGGKLPPQDGYLAGPHWRLNGGSGDGTAVINTAVSTSAKAPGGLPAISRPRPAAHSVPTTTAAGGAAAATAAAASIRVRARPGLSTPAANWQHLGEVPDVAEEQHQEQHQGQEGKVRLPSMAPPTPPLGQASAESRPGTSIGARVSGIARRLGSLGSLITRLPMPMRRPQLPPMGPVGGVGEEDVPEVPEMAQQSALTAGAGAVRGDGEALGGAQGGRVGGGEEEGEGVGGAVEVGGQWGVGRAGSGRAGSGRAGSNNSSGNGNGSSAAGAAVVAVRPGGRGGVSVRAAASVDGGPEERGAAAEREFVGQGFVRRNTRPEAGSGDTGPGVGNGSGGGGGDGLAMSRRQRRPQHGNGADDEEEEEGPEDVSSPVGAWGGGNGMTAGAVSRGRRGNRGHGEEEEGGEEEQQQQERGRAGGMWASKGRGPGEEGSNALTNGAGGQGATRDARNASAPVAVAAGYGGYNGMTAGAMRAGSRKQYGDADQEEEYDSRANVRTRKMQSADAGPLTMTSGADRYGSRARRDDADDDRPAKAITKGKKDEPYMSVNPTYGTLMTAGADRRRYSSDEEDAGVTAPVAVPPPRPPAAPKPKKAQPRQSTLMAMAFNPFAVQRDSVLMTKGEGALLDPSFQKDLAQRAGMAEARAAVSRRGTRQGSRADGPAGEGDGVGKEWEGRYAGRPAGPVAEGEEEGTHGADAALLGGSTPARRLALPPLPPLAGLAPLPPLAPIASAAVIAATGAAVLVGTPGAGGGSGSSAVAAVADDSLLLRQATSRALIHGVRTGSASSSSSRGGRAASAKLSRQASGAGSGSVGAAAAAAAARDTADNGGSIKVAAGGSLTRGSPTGGPDGGGVGPSGGDAEEDGSPANQGSSPAADGVTHGSTEGRQNRPVGRRPGVGRYGLWEQILTVTAKRWRGWCSANSGGCRLHANVLHVLHGLHCCYEGN